MKFSDYMYEWLYGESGYYTDYREIGKSGDFYTSVSTSKFFGGSIGKYIVTLIEEGRLSANCTVCEIGAHHGYLMADIIEFIYTLKPELLQSLEFVIVERFDAMQAHQRRYLEECFGNAIRLRHVKSLVELSLDEAFFYANEIFDAFPCELFYKGKCASVVEGKIEFDHENAWVSETAARYHKDRGEIAVGYEAFALEMADAAKRFEFISFDYGEMQARPDFSIRVYQEHEVIPLFDEKLELAACYKQSDITYDVTFAHVKEAFEAAGIGFVDCRAQMTALVDMGLLELLEILHAHVEEKAYKQELEKAKMLILPDFLGERFKMIRFRKGMQ